MTNSDAKGRLPLITSVATRLARQYGSRLGAVEFEDLLAFGSKGLLDAERRFDPARKVAFETFAYRRIRGAMLDGVRATGPFSRAQCERHRADPADVLVDGLLGNAAVTQEPIEDELDRRRLLDLVFATLEEVEPRLRLVVEGYFLKGKTLAAIGAEMGASRSWVCRLVDQGIRSIRERIAAAHPDVIDAGEGASGPTGRKRGTRCA